MLPHQSKSFSSVNATTGRSLPMRAGLIAGSLPSIAEAQALRDALIAAYRNNPALQSQRFRTRASDESVARARSGYRPRVSGEAFAGLTAARRDRDGEEPTYGLGLSIEQPLFDGFQTHYAVAEAKSGVLASRNELKAQENEILLQTASAYFDVLRDEGILLYRRKTLNALRRELIGARQRMTHGDATNFCSRTAGPRALKIVIGWHVAQHDQIEIVYSYSLPDPFGALKVAQKSLV